MKLRNYNIDDLINELQLCIDEAVDVWWLRLLRSLAIRTVRMLRRGLALLLRFCYRVRTVENQRRAPHATDL